MGYSTDIEDLPDGDLLRELVRRGQLRRAGKCAYCRQLVTATNSCRRVDEHNNALRQWREEDFKPR